MPNQTYLKTIETTRNLSNGIVTATQYELIETFGFGDKVIEKYLNYGTAEQRTQTYQYYTDLADYGYGKVSQKIDFDGKWTKYEYDVNGRLIKEVSPFGDALITAEEDECQVITYDYTKLDSSETNDPSDNPRWRTKVTTICDQETAREFRQFFSNQEKHIVAVKPGVLYSDVSNKVTTTNFIYYYDQFCEENIKRETRIENPDGTTVEISYINSSYYNPNPSQTVYTTQKTSINKFLNNVLSREVELKNHFGTVESLRRYDLASGVELLIEGYNQTVDRHGRPLVKTDIDNHVTTFEYYQAQVPDGEYTNPILFDHVQTTRPDGSVLIEAFDTWKNKIFELYDGITTFYHYDAYGNTISTTITGRNGGTLETVEIYNDDNIKVSETDANGNTTTYSSGTGWDSKTDTLNNVFKLEYFLDGRLKNVKVNNSVQRYYAHEIIDNEIVSIEYASETEWNKSITAFDGYVRQHNYPDGYVQNIYFDEYGNQCRIVDNSGNENTVIYNETTGQIFQQWQNGVLTEFDKGFTEDENTSGIYYYDKVYSYYQEAKVLSSETRAYRNGLKEQKLNSGNTQTTVKEYRGDGEIMETVTTDDITIINIYLNGQLQSSGNDTLGITEYVFDEFNRLLGYDYTENDVSKSIRYTLDDNGNILSITQSAGNDNRTFDYEFDVLNRKIKEITPEGIETVYAYNAQNRIIEISGGIFLQKYEYDIQGRMTTLTAYKDTDTPEVTTFEYDNRGRMCQKAYDDESMEEFSYRGDGNIANGTNARGQVIQCSYDIFNRMVAIQGAGIYWEFSYDYRGLLLRACNGSYHQNFGYDEYGKLISENFSDIPNTEIAYFYDEVNRPTGYSFAENQVHYTYDVRTGILNGVHSGNWKFIYNRISGSNKLFQTIAKLNNNTVNTATRRYNNFGDLIDVNGYAYELDSDGKRLKATLPDGKEWAYSYDGLSQVTGGVLSNNLAPLSSHTYTYDMIGNRLTANDNDNIMQYTANNLNQYTAISSTILTYDADGNMLFDGQFTYSYDALNQLISVDNAIGKQIFDYDFMGRRIIARSYIKDGDDWTLVTTRRYIYMGWNVIAEYVNGAQAKTYVWGEDFSETLQEAGGVGGLLLERNCQGDYLPTYDGNGNIIAYKNFLGNVVANYSYDPFGNIVNHSGLDFTYKFSTKPQDELSTLYYYGYRFYSSQYGRWISRDPVREYGGVNLYLMGNNNSINYRDFLGLCTKGEKRNITSRAMVTAGNPSAIEAFSPKEAEDWEKVLDILEDINDLSIAAAKGPQSLAKEVTEKIIAAIGEKAWEGLQKKIVSLGEFLAGRNYRLYTKVYYQECTSFCGISYWKNKSTGWRACELKGKGSSRHVWGIYEDISKALEDRQDCIDEHMMEFNK